MAAHLPAANRNKRSIVLDLKKPAGREALLRLVASADVLIYNVRPAGDGAAGAGLRDVRAVNPRIVYVGVYGFGQNGPYAAKPAYDDLIQGAAGMPMLMQLRRRGRAALSRPARSADRIAGLSAANAISCRAVPSRAQRARASAIEVPMFETMAQFVLGDHMGGQTFEPPIGPTGYARLLDAEPQALSPRRTATCAC